MGYYVNPDNESKEAFLEREGVRTTPPTSYAAVPENAAMVCLIDNKIFTAACIVYSQRELEDCTDPTDARSRRWFAVDRSKLYAVSDITPERFENQQHGSASRT